MHTVLWFLLSLTPAAGHATAHDAFFERLADLCGARFEGETVFPDDPGEAFRGQPLVAEFTVCEAHELRIGFAVGPDRSRTWVITRRPDGLELKHDHRHADGSPDEITNYGGTTTADGTAGRQSFPADAFTADLIPEAATNVWTLILSDDGQELTYDLTRHGAPRYRAVLQRQPDE